MPSDRPDRLVVEPFAARHVPAAAILAADRYARSRAACRILPAAWEDPGAHVPGLEELAARGSGVAALRAGALAGFLAGYLLDGHGGRWAFSPDPGHAAGSADRALLETLYARVAGDWMTAGCTEHVIAVLAHETATMDALVGLGFGVRVVDLVRDLSPVVARAPEGIAIGRAGPPDAARLMALEDQLRRHLAASPVFHHTPTRALELHRRRLEDPATATFVAEDPDRQPVAYLRIRPCAPDAATVVRDPGTASITGAFTVPGRRGEDVATALLDQALAWARANGYLRCAVDHESANLEAARFWRRHFEPVACAMARRIQPPPLPGTIL